MKAIYAIYFSNYGDYHGHADYDDLMTVRMITIMMMIVIIVMIKIVEMSNTVEGSNWILEVCRAVLAIFMPKNSNIDRRKSFLDPLKAT